MIETILIAVAMAALYALLGYAKSVGENVDLTKAGATIVLGAVIGVVMFASGVPVTEFTIAGQMAMYGGLLYVIENTIKAVLRRLKRE